MRRSENPWAQRIAQRRGYKLLLQFTERDERYALEPIEAALADAGLEYFTVTSLGALSRGGALGEPSGLYVLDSTTGETRDIRRYTPLYTRMSEPLRLTRVFVTPEHRARAESVLDKLQMQQPNASQRLV